MLNFGAAIESLEYASKSRSMAEAASIVGWFDGLILFAFFACTLWGLIDYQKSKGRKHAWKICHPSSFLAGIFIAIHFALGIQKEAFRSASGMGEQARLWPPMTLCVLVLGNLCFAYYFTWKEASKNANQEDEKPLS
ncbi:MAG: hypothetical protein B9S32_07640 [Verrucomicrobia bacterium Tous-C9LFEB]|nr:MAG: hypothetical protein B9S32_07640 [Verrucomicrobia bacterium Tous-C9LFEB]